MTTFSSTGMENPYLICTSVVTFVKRCTYICINYRIFGVEVHALTNDTGFVRMMYYSKFNNPRFTTEWSRDCRAARIYHGVPYEKLKETRAGPGLWENSLQYGVLKTLSSHSTRFWWLEITWRKVVAHFLPQCSALQEWLIGNVRRRYSNDVEVGLFVRLQIKIYTNTAQAGNRT